MLRRAFPWVALLTLPAFPQCEAGGAAKRALEEVAGIPVEKAAERLAILEKALQNDPVNYFLLDQLRGMLDEDATREALVARLSALYDKYPGSAAVAVVYAHALRTTDSMKSVEILESVERSRPEFPFTHLRLLPVYGWGRFQNDARLREETEAWLKSCPASGGYVYRVMLARGAPEQIARHAVLLRARLEAGAGAPNQELYTVLWDMEFKAVPPVEHEAVRERIARDLAGFDKSPGDRDVDFLTFLRGGYSRIGNKAASYRIEEQILKDHPDSRMAQSLVSERWHKEHPFPRDGDQAAQQGWHRTHASAVRQWRKRWPADNMLFREEFTSTAALEDTRPEELSKLAEAYVADYRARASWYGALPMEFDVAEALLRKNMAIPAIPDWLEEGYRREINRSSRLLGQARDNLTDEQKTFADRQVANMRIARARILLDFYEALGQPAKSRSVEDSVAGVNAPEALKPALYEVRAKAARMDGRKLDALVLYRAARDLQPEKEAEHKRELQALVDTLWNELGGTDAARSVFTGTRFESVSTAHWEKPRKPIPMFSLPDLNGKTWKLADLAGRAVLINVWATWCGPCRAEHSDFQRLYDKLKDRKDVAVLSLSVDDSVGLVAPYMKENRYTFPVIADRRLMEAVGLETIIPQNWFISPGGRLEAVQVGYSAGPDWEKIITAKLDEVLKSK